MKLIIIISIFLAGISAAFAQEFTAGARTTAMGNTGVAMQDAWSAFQNMSGLGSVKKASLLMGYQNHFSFSEGMHTMGAGLVLPTQWGVGSLGVSRFGDHFFSLHQLSLGYGHQIEQFSLGIRLSEQQYSMEGFGSRNIAVIDMGGMAQVLPQLMWGLLIRNVNRATLSTATGERKRAVVQTGFSYRPVTGLMLNLEVEQEIHQPLVVKAGAEYLWKQRVGFRTGVDGRNKQQYFGMGLYHPVLHFDYALSMHTMLGFSHHLSLAYQLQNK